jgi:hypothetical protein
MRLLWKWLMILIGMLLLIIGLITFPLPIPIGLPILLLGLVMVIRHSSDAKRYLIRLSKRFPKLQRFMHRRKKVFGATAKDPVD